MAHQNPLGTIKHVAFRLTRTAGRLSGRAVDEVTARLAARRAGSPPTPTASRQTSAPPAPRAAQAPLARAVPSPADVARAIARNGAPRPRPAAQPARTRRPTKSTTPGAKLPARAGHGILGV